jgi:hypothetical protein
MKRSTDRPDGAPAVAAPSVAKLNPDLAVLRVPNGRALDRVRPGELKLIMRAAGVPFPGDAGHARVAELYGAFIHDLRAAAADAAEERWRRAQLMEHGRGPPVLSA